jgi:plasmid stability protein
MKTTLNIDAQVMTRLKAEAARQGRTMSELVETALRRSLEPDRPQTQLRPLPTFRGGREMVDVSNRDALYRLMEEG